MGFSNFFKSILGNDEIIIPLLAFNLGVELAQIVIVLFVLICSYFFVEKLKLNQKYWVWLLSLPVAVYSVKLILERI